MRDTERNVIAYLRSLENRIKNVEEVVLELLVKLKAAGVIYDSSGVSDAEVVPWEDDN